MASRRDDHRSRSSRSAARRSRKPRLFDLTDLLEAGVRFAKPIAVILGLVMLMVAYNVVSGSPLFALRHVAVTGASNGLRAEIEQTVRSAVGEARLLDINLKSLRDRVESLPRVRGARLARVLPDELRIAVEERQPAVLTLRRSGDLVWLDADAIDLGEWSRETAVSGKAPPIARGFAEGNRTQLDMADDKERVKVYKQIERELADGHLWNAVDQIDLTESADAHLYLAPPRERAEAGIPTRIHIGSRDFRNRVETALKILDAAWRGDLDLLRRFRVQNPEAIIENKNCLNFIDAARSDRIVVNHSNCAAKAPQPAPAKPKPNEPPNQRTKQQMKDSSRRTR